MVTYGRTPALRGLDLRIRAGMITGLLGSNGAGKSTTIAILAGLRKLDSGRCVVLDGPPGSASARASVGVMLQDDGLPTGARAAEIVRHVARLRSQPDSAEPLIDRLGIGAFERTTIRRLSGGERRRVSLACALVGTPALVLLDEPTAGLDPRGRQIVADILRELREAGVAILLSTHLINEAEELSDEVAVIGHGRTVAQGTVAELTAGGEEFISFTTSAHLDIAALAQALPTRCTVTEDQPGRYRITGSAEPAVLATVSSWCSAQGVAPRHLEAGQASLEDVFWRLTQDEAS